MIWTDNTIHSFSQTTFILQKLDLNIYLNLKTSSHLFSRCSKYTYHQVCSWYYHSSTTTVRLKNSTFWAHGHMVPWYTMVKHDDCSFRKKEGLNIRGPKWRGPKCRGPKCPRVKMCAHLWFRSRHLTNSTTAPAERYCVKS